MIETGGELSLLDRVELYLRVNEMRPSAFGVYAVGTPSLVARMRAGKRLRLITIERVETFLAERAFVRRPPLRSRRSVAATRYRKAIQEQLAAELAERHRRAGDPREQAAIYLRSRGWRVTRATVHEEGAVDWCVGIGRKTDDELLTMARRNGWRG